MKLIKLSLLFFLIITLNSCISYPKERVIPEIEPFLNLDYVPNAAEFSPENPELKEIIKAQRELYSYILKVLIVCRESEDFFTEDIDKEIEYINQLIEWFDSLVQMPGE